MTTRRVLIAGAGQAGFQTADALARGGYDGDIVLAGAEPHPPYQRPPLSKAHLAEPGPVDDVMFRPKDYYAERGVTLMTSTTVEAIDLAAMRARLSGAVSLPFSACVIATGARVRTPPIPGVDAAGVHYVRTVADSARLHAAAGDAHRIVIIGAGFIGLETAAVFATAGKTVTVVESADRVLARVSPPIISSFYAARHARAGVTVRTGATVNAIRSDGDGVTGVALDGGDVIAADLVVVGVGVIPNDALAREAGLDVDQGVLVDDHTRCLRGGAPVEGVHAAGDCARGVNAWLGRAALLESVQNAIDQAKVAAAAILGQPQRYDAVPWFWSDQYDLKLQMAGVSEGADQEVVRGDPAEGAFTVFYFRDGVLIAADSVNRPGDHMAARKLLHARAPVTADALSDPTFDLREAVRAAAP